MLGLEGQSSLGVNDRGRLLVGAASVDLAQVLPVVDHELLDAQKRLVLHVSVRVRQHAHHCGLALQLLDHTFQQIAEIRYFIKRSHKSSF